MPYNYNYHRRKRLQSEYELTLAQMAQTVLNENVEAPSGVFFKYSKEIYSKSGDIGTFFPEVYVPKTTMTFTAKEQTTPSKTLSISSTTGAIRPDLSDIGVYNVTCDFGSYLPPKIVNGQMVRPAFEGGKHTIVLTIRG